MAEGVNSIANASITKCTLLRYPRVLLSAFGQRGMHLNAHLNSVYFCALAAGMPLYGNGDIALAVGETVLEQGERSKAIYKV